MRNTSTTSPSPICGDDTTLVDRWLAERRELIASYCAVSSSLGQEIFGPMLRKQLGGFLDLLVDYVSAGHFEIYGELLGRAETGHIDTANLMGQFYPQVEESTDLALAFDEHCAQTANANLESLQQRLSELGEVMEARFSVEDKLISLVRGVDQILAA